MNPAAAQELLDLIMLDDFVERREALDTWTRRWVTTLRVAHTGDREMPVLLCKPLLMSKLWEAIRGESQPVLAWFDPTTGEDLRNRLRSRDIACEMHVVRQEPFMEKP